MSEAMKKQVAGTHYLQKKIQPWDVIQANEMGFFDGNVLRYVMRYKEKNGVEDLRKAIHYLEKLIEIECNRPLIPADFRDHVEEQEGGCNGK